jgi:hypothetical protein
VILPQGRINCTAKIVIGSNTVAADRVWGLRVIGQGSGIQSGTTDQGAGTSIVWNGAADLNDGVIEVQGASDAYFSDFTIIADDPDDGVGSCATEACADYCIKGNPNVPGGTPWAFTLRNTWQNVSCYNAAVAGVYWTGVAGDDQSEMNLFDRVNIGGSSPSARIPKCIQIDNQNTQNFVFRDSHCQNYSTAGVHVQDGNFKMIRSIIINGAAGSKAIHWDEDLVGPPVYGADNLYVRDSFFESDDGDFIDIDRTTTGAFISITGNRFYSDATSGNQDCLNSVIPSYLEYRHNRCLVPGAGTGSVIIDPDPGGTLQLGYSLNEQEVETIDWAEGNIVGGLKTVRRPLPLAQWTLDGSNAPASTVIGTNFRRNVFAFDQTTDECIYVETLLPSSYESTAPDQLLIPWSGAGTGTVCWCVATVDVAEDAARDPTAEVTNCESESQATSGDLRITPVPFTGTYAASASLLLQVCRDGDGAGGNCASDTLAVDAMLHEAPILELGVDE